MLDLLKQRVRPEFINRIDEIVLFQPLSKNHVCDIIRIQMHQVSKTLEKNEILITTTDEAIAHLAEIGYDPAMGARPVKRVIQREILNEMSRQILQGKINPKDNIIIDVVDGHFYFRNPSM